MSDSSTGDVKGDDDESAGSSACDIAKTVMVVVASSWATETPCRRGRASGGDV